MIVRRDCWFTWRGLTFDVSNPNVYPPKPASLLLAEVAVETIRPGGRILEACTGSGVIGIALAKVLPGISVVATDTNATAVSVALKNAERNGVRLDVRLGDLYAPFEHQLFDGIMVHPPAVPYAPRLDWGLSAGMREATDGGPDGSAVILRAICEAHARLRDGGRLLLLLPHWSNYRKAQDALVQRFGSFERLAERRVEFFPATEGNPSPAMWQYAISLSEAGLIDLDFSENKPTSRVSVIQALKQ